MARLSQSHGIEWLTADVRVWANGHPAFLHPAESAFADAAAVERFIALLREKVPDTRRLR